MTDASPPCVVLVHHPDDATEAEALATSLRTGFGLDVWLKGWEVIPGDSIVQRLEDGIAKTEGGLILVTARGFEPWMSAVYEALVGRAVAFGKLLIPLVTSNATPLPPFLANRQPLDAADHDAIARAVLQQTGRLGSSKPTLGQPWTPPREVDVELELAREGEFVCVRHRELEGRTQVPADAIEPMRARLRPPGHTREPLRSLGSSALDVIGRQLGEAFAGPLGLELAETLDPSTTRGEARVILRAADASLLTIPWEAAHLPNRGPLALIRRVSIVRTLATRPRATAIPGPLRVLVAVASPGDDLDVEQELERIQTGLEQARAGRPRVVFIDEASSTLAAIRTQLDAEPFHVLHLSCHGEPGKLQLERETGEAVLIDAQRLADELLAAKHPPRVVVLSSCSSGSLDVDRLGVAQTLLHAGIPEVIAMQGSVGDGYATELAGGFYARLAIDSSPSAARALAVGRCDVEQARRDAQREGQQFRAPEPEYATPVCFAAREHVDVPLYDGSQSWDVVPEPPEMTGVAGLAQRPIGWVVGRRQQRRALRRELTATKKAGVLLWGVGGAGKSTLAASLAAQLVREGWHAVVVVGAFSLQRLAHALLEQVEHAAFTAMAQRRGVAAPSRAYFDALDERALLAFLRELVKRERVLVLLDNFEDNLLGDIPAEFRADARGPLRAKLPLGVSDPLDKLLAAVDRGAVLVTCRYDLEGEWARHELHELSRPALRRLVWRLPGLLRASERERDEALELLGGHPRVLEFADALLRSVHDVEAAFRDVRERLEKFAETEGRALSAGSDRERLELARKAALVDVLFNELLDTLDEDTRRFLVAAAVYRRAVPVDAFEAVARAVGLAWHDEEVRRALARLGSRTLIARASEPGRWIVHRWTAGALHAAGVPIAAHEAAAQWWLHGAPSWEDAWEAVEHWLAAGRLDEASQLAEFGMRVPAAQSGRTSAALAISERMVAALPDPGRLRAPWLRNAADHFRDFGQADLALRYFDDSLSIAKQLVEREPGRADLLRDLSVSYDRLGDLHRDLGHADLALRYFDDSLSLRQQLVEREPGRADLLRDLCISFERMATVQPERAAEWLGRSLENRRRVCAQAPNVAVVWRELAIVLVQLGAHTQDVEALREGYEILANLRARGALEAQFHNLVDRLATMFASPT